MKIKKLAVLFASVALAASLVTGCSAGQKETAAEAAGTADETAAPETEADESAEAAEEAKEDEENYAYFRSFLADYKMSAVSALPHCLFRFLKYSFHLHII